MWYCEGSCNNFIFFHTYCSCVVTKVQRYTIIYSLYSNYILGTCLQRRIVKLFPWRHGIALVLMPFFFSWYGIKLVLMFFSDSGSDVAFCSRPTSSWGEQPPEQCSSFDRIIIKRYTENYWISSLKSYIIGYILQL